MIGKFSFRSLLHDILKESEIQEKEKIRKVIDLYVLDFKNSFLQRSQTVI